MDVDGKRAEESRKAAMWKMRLSTGSVHAQLTQLRMLGASAAPVERRTLAIVSAFDQRADHTSRAHRTHRWGPKARKALRSELRASGVAVEVAKAARGELWRSFASHAVVAAPHRRARAAEARGQHRRARRQRRRSRTRPQCPC